MERSSDKHGFRLDDAMAAETRGLTNAGHGTHAEEWKDPEPSGEDQPDVARSPAGTLSGAIPEGMTSSDVEGRSELASYLGQHVFPADRDVLIERARETSAPDRVLSLIDSLPGDEKFDNVAQVWTVLGGGSERHRF